MSENIQTFKTKWTNNHPWSPYWRIYSICCHLKLNPNNYINPSNSPIFPLSISLLYSCNSIISIFLYISKVVPKSSDFNKHKYQNFLIADSLGQIGWIFHRRLNVNMNHMWFLLKLFSSIWGIFCLSDLFPLLASNESYVILHQVIFNGNNHLRCASKGSSLKI